MTTIDIPDNWLPTGENLNALPEPLRKYIHDLHTASDNATLVRQEALTRAEYNILRKMIAEAPEAIVTCATGSDVEAFGTNGSGNLKCRVRVKLLEVGDE